MITVERFGRIVSRVHVFAAGFVNASEACSGTRGIFSRNVVVCIDVVMVEIESELEIVGHAVFELFAKIDNAIRDMFLFSAWCDPLLEFAMTFRRKVSGISP